MSVNPGQSTVVSMVTQSSAQSHSVATTSHVVTGTLVLNTLSVLGEGLVINILDFK